MTGYEVLTRQIIQSKGGLMLTVFKGASTKIKVQCGKGHQWDVTPSNIKIGKWCPHCSGRGTKESNTQEFLTYVQAKGGVVLTGYVGANKSIRLKCHKGHEWESTPSSIKRGGWCHWCSGYWCDYMTILRDIATSKGGYLISTEYKHAHAKLEWQCSRGHKWEASSNNIQSGKWCPECNGGVRYTRDYIALLAQMREGELLSPIYNNRNDVLEWRCRNGHVWKNTANMIIKGVWCKDCVSDEIIKATFEQVAKRNGKFLGPHFTKASDKYKWECIMAHVWETTMSNIKQGKWCPICKQSRGEFECSIVLKKLGIPYTPQYKAIETSLLRYDFAFNYNGILWFLEFDGIQHFEPIHIFHGETNFEDARSRDISKSQLAISHGNLIRIHYSDIKQTETHITNALQLNQKVYYSSPNNYKWIDETLPSDVLTNLRYKPLTLVIS